MVNVITDQAILAVIMPVGIFLGLALIKEATKKKDRWDKIKYLQFGACKFWNTLISLN
jgi:hypothetical protein